MIDFNKLAALSKSAPRYTSYPTANEFNSSFTHQKLKDLLQQSNAIAKKQDLPLSLYTHLPFCKSACYFCGCNVIYTSKEDKKQKYIEYLKKELELLKSSIDVSREVVQFHFGGGTPTFFSASQLKEVIDSIRAVFTNFKASAEISCEIDPRHFSQDQMDVLKDAGFNRISFGVQDFDLQVQQAINRIQSFDLVKNALNIARSSGINSINFDLIYGLPKQSAKSFRKTLEEVALLSPDRIAIFNYAHVPWIKKTMRKINEFELPLPSTKIEILKNSIEFLESIGYEMIGMDHFAKKSDELSICKNKGILRRNFQGYTTKGFSQTIGIGITSISEGLNFYAQNFKDMASYEAALDSNKLPLNIGIELDSEDMLRKEVIMSLMNNSFVSFAKINKEFNIDFKEHFKSELESLEALAKDELVEISTDSIKATKLGGMLIRNIAMVFDGYLAKNKKAMFSKSV